MQFYFIRHGQSSNNLLYDTSGSSIGRSEDPELTTTGRHQAEILARFLRTGSPDLPPSSQNKAQGFGLTHLYTSLMVRSVATGTIIAKELGLPLAAWEDVHETGGIYLDDEATGQRVGQTGKNRAFFRKNYPDLVLPDGLYGNGWWNRPFEEPEQTIPRAERFLRELISRHGNPADRVAVISHGGFYNRLLWAILGLAPEKSWFTLCNAAITRIDLNEQVTGVDYMNRVEFLPQELIT